MHRPLLSFLLFTVLVTVSAARRRNAHSDGAASRRARSYILVDYRTDKVLRRAGSDRAHGAREPHEADDGLHRFPEAGRRHSSSSMSP